MSETISCAETTPLPPVLITSVGSLPHTYAGQAVDLIVRSLRAAPHAPQLPRLDPREQMWIQFVEHLPRFTLDLENLQYYFDTSGNVYPDVEVFYSHYLAVEEGGDADHFRIGHEHGQGIEAFFDRVGAQTNKLPFIKVQVTGPLSFGLTITDETRKPIFYHPIFRDVIVKAMGLKAVWLLEKCKLLAENVIVFFDEPSLSAYGSSAFLGVSHDDVVQSLNEVMEMVAVRGGIPGVHCCGNTDWGMLMETSVRIVNFDAVDYLESMAIYRKDLNQFLERGGVLAWGVVRNTEKVRTETSDDVLHRLNEGVAFLDSQGVDKKALTKKIVLTPACGCAGMSEPDAQQVYKILAELESKTS